MLLYKRGDLLEAEENIICHQCNTEGVFGGGIAAQIKNFYPDCELETIKMAEIFGPSVLGMVHYHRVNDSKYVANCFSQNEDFTTNYDMVSKVFTEILTIAKKLDMSVAMPYKYGCGIAKGDWDTIVHLLNVVSTQVDHDIYIYQRECDL